MSELQADNLRLTDFMDVQTLQEIQDSFAAVANVKATITDALGNLLTQPAPTSDFLKRQQTLAAAEDSLPEGPQKAGREYVAPIIVAGQRLGTVRMAANPSTTMDDAKIAQLAEKFGIESKSVKSMLTQLSRQRNTRPAAIQFL